MALRLHQFRQIFKKLNSMSKYNETSLQVVGGVLSVSTYRALPVELWYHIFSMIDDKSDLSRLSRTCRYLQSICQPYIYHSLDIYIDLFWRQRLERLSHAMQNRRLSEYVTYCFIEFENRPIPATTERRQINKLMGKVMVPLRNLQGLTHRCKICIHGLGGMYHSYLQRLKTRRLTKLVLYGECFTRPPHRSIGFRILCAPCMRMVTSLDLGTAIYQSLTPAELALVESDSFLPHLTEVTSAAFAPFASHLRKGTITSIRTNESRSDLHTVLFECPPALLYLYHEYLQDWLPEIVSHSSPFLKIRSMKWFYFAIIESVSQ